MGYFDYTGFDDPSSTIDVATDATDAGTMGDAPQADTIPDYGSIASSALTMVGAGVPNVTQTASVGGAVMAGAGAIGRMLPATLVSAIVKLSQRLGGASGSVAAYGAKVWASLSSWAAKNPGVSLVSTLLSLGLTAEEAAHFIAWGATKRKRRRQRGVSGRDMKTTRRTMRKLNSYVQSLRHLCSPASYHPRRHHFARRK